MVQTPAASVRASLLYMNFSSILCKHSNLIMFVHVCEARRETGENAQTICTVFTKYRPALSLSLALALALALSLLSLVSSLLAMQYQQSSTNKFLIKTLSASLLYFLSRSLQASAHPFVILLTSKTGQSYALKF
jgi:hypothetical protein